MPVGSDDAPGKQHHDDAPPPVLLIGGTVLTARADGAVLRDVDVLIENGRISAVAPKLAADGAQRIDARGSVIAPGLVDTHLHAWQYPWRGVGQRKWGFGPYAALLDRARDAYSPEDTGHAVLAAAVALIDNGVTGVVDFLHGANTSPEHLQAAIAAHRTAGIRAVVHSGITTSYDLAPDAFERARRRRLDHLEQLAADRSADGDLVQVGLALPTPNEDLRSVFLEEVAFARDRGLRMTFHQNRSGDVTALDDAGLLGPDIVAAHANSLTDRELSAMHQAAMPVSFTPRSELSDVRATDVYLRAVTAGVPVSFGIDSPVFLPINLRGELRAAYDFAQYFDGEVARRSGRLPMDGRLDPQLVTVDTIMRAATVGGNHALGIGGAAGEVSVGAPADLVIHRPHDPGPALADPAAHLVLAAGHPSEVDTVLIGGAIRKQNGRVLGVDRDALREHDCRLRARVLGVLGDAGGLLPA